MADADFLERTLDALASGLELAGLGWADPPEVLKAGGENSILALRLSGAPESLSGPLILRLYPPERDPLGVRFEAALHGALLEQGFPVPRVSLACEDAKPLGGAFLLMERLPGRILLEEIGALDAVFASPLRAARTLPRMIWEAWSQIPEVLASTLARLHALDAAPIARALEGRGVAVDPFTVKGRLADLGERARKASLDGMLPALTWLREHRVPERRRVLCHADLQFLNVLVEGPKVRGVIDWSTQHCTFGDPLFDVGNTAALLELRVPGLPAALRPVFEAVQRRMLRRFRALCARHGALDEESLRWAVVYRYTREMIACGELLARGERATSGYLQVDEAPWLIPELRAWVLAAIEARAGVPAWLPER